ncbi:hypothetical protein Dip510_001764 [Elusimicrobium posterum]|uniref:hypothetical protein n=1 Tax=Elusimicrobium posterum TaxID=3116653 RepID=UPI003C707739
MKSILNKIGAISQKAAMFAGAGAVATVGLGTYVVSNMGDDSGYIRANQAQTEYTVAKGAGMGMAYTYGEEALAGDTKSLTAAMTSGVRSGYTGVAHGAAPVSQTAGMESSGMRANVGGGLEGMRSSNASLDPSMLNSMNIPGMDGMQGMNLLDANALQAKLAGAGGAAGGGSLSAGSGSALSGGGSRGGASFNPNDTGTQTLKNNPVGNAVGTPGANNTGRANRGNLSGFQVGSDRSLRASQLNAGNAPSESVGQMQNVMKRLSSADGSNAYSIQEALLDGGVGGGQLLTANTMNPEGSETALDRASAAVKGGSSNTSENTAIDLKEKEEALRKAREKTIQGLVAIFVLAAVVASVALAIASKVPIFGHAVALGIAIGVSAAAALLMWKILDNHSDGVNVSTGMKVAMSALVVAGTAGVWASFGIPAAQTAIIGALNKIYVWQALAGTLLYGAFTGGAMKHALTGGAGAEKKAYDAAKAAHSAGGSGDGGASSGSSGGSGGNTGADSGANADSSGSDPFRGETDELGARKGKDFISESLER